jgi:hypothetical protein
MSAEKLINTKVKQFKTVCQKKWGILKNRINYKSGSFIPFPKRHTNGTKH